MLDAPDRCQVVELLAVLAYQIEHSPLRPAARAALGTLRPTLLGLVTGAHPGVRTMAAWLLGILGRGDDAPAVTARTVAALRSGLAEDFDPSARSSRLRALAALVPLDLCDDLGLEELRHPVALVRLAAAERVYRRRAASAAPYPWPAGFGRVVGQALASATERPWPRSPWSVERRDETRRWARRLVGQPDELAAMTAALTPPPPAPVSTGAVLAAHVWLATRRDAPGHLWVTVIDGLWVGAAASDAAARVLRDAGSAAAPHADRLLEWLRSERAPSATGICGTVAALMGVGDRRALPWVPDRWFTPWPVSVTVPAAWAPDLLPGAVARLRAAHLADSELPSLLRALAAWGPEAANAVALARWPS
ncbi:hypothetical protein [Streptomyces sp. NPDC127114]|uniref:hypothetical protein n=1 Tax=Streptomyces sp. NPDC127114 TaxID=3345366 RepID=UPI00362D3D23